MPEGHTIHRLARNHSPLLVGNVVAASSPQGRFADGAALLSGRVVERIEPYGKHLFYGFAGEVLLHVHLGLYGTWLHGDGVPPEPRGALRLRLTTADPDGAPGSWFFFIVTSSCEIYTSADRDRVLARLGPDPLRRDADPELAWARLSRSRTPIGQLLMDQSVLAGVGNVYRAELLYRAGLSPFRPGRDVDRPTWEAMWADLRTLLRAGVRAGHIVTTLREDRDRRSGPPRREDRFYVYRRTDLPCRRCGTPVRTQVMATRNLYWCPVCQPA